MKIKAWRSFSAAVLLAASAVRLSADETTVIPPGGYPAAAEREIDGAARSVRLYLYLFSLQNAQPDAGPSRLARALARAEARGVDVQVTLDKSADALDPSAGDDKNLAAARALAAAGAEVFITTGSAPLHAKALIIDEGVSLVGSSNWSSSAFTRNAEADVLIRSTAAAALLDSFSGVPRMRLPVDSSATVGVPLAFIDSPAGLGAMARADDPRALDAYLHFLAGGAVPGKSWPVDAEALARAVGLAGPKRDDDRRQIHKILVRLRDNHHLISFVEGFNQDPAVTLSTAAEGPALWLDGEYFRFGWDRKLTLAGKCFLLWDLRYSTASAISPRWSAAESTLAARHGVSVWFLQKGVTELRRANLLEARYDDLSETGNDDRRPTVYSPNPFYDPAERAARMKALGERYGPAALARAQSLAALVYEDNDVEGIETLITLERKLGPQVINEAARAMADKKPDNPKRSMGYLIGYLQRRLLK